MGLYNFQPRFAPRIRAWDADPESPLAKAHTIRAPRKGGREDKPGDTMYLYTGLRQKGAARIIENTHAEATFQVTDVLKALGSIDIMRTYMRPAIIALATKIETDILGLYAQFTSNTPVGLPATTMTEATIDNAETTLFSSLVPMSDQLNLVVNPATYSAMRQIERFSEVRMNGELGGNAINNGTLLKAKGFNVFRSQYVVQTGSGTIATHNLAFHRDAIGLIVRKLPTAIPGTGAIQDFVEQSGFGLRVTLAYVPGQLAQQMTIDCLYGVGVLRNSFGVRVES